MSARILGVLGILVGGAGAILSLLVAFGVDISPDQHEAILAFLSLLMLALGAWVHPDVPVGTTESKPPPGAGP